MQQEGKRESACLGDRGMHVDTRFSVDKFQVILDYVLGQVVGDERPYLTVEVLGKKLLGLLDSGASRTIIGNKGIKFIEDLGLGIDRSKKSSCTVANGDRCQCIGVVNVPMCLKGRCHLIECLVIPEVSHLLILGADFWRTMGVVPDLSGFFPMNR